MAGVYHRRDVCGPRASFLLAFGVLTACATGGNPKPVQWESGQHVADHGALRVELAGAMYRPEGLDITMALANVGDKTLTVERDGILLEYGDLEFPVFLGDGPQSAPPTQSELQPGGRVQLDVTFETGSELIEPATLRFRAVRRGDDWLDAMALQVPAAPMERGRSRRR